MVLLVKQEYEDLSRVLNEPGNERNIAKKFAVN